MLLDQPMRRLIALSSLGLALSLYALGCAPPREPEPRDAPTMRTALLDAIPLRTPIDDARATIEQRGFTCRDVERGNWIDLVAPGRSGGVRSDIDIMYCSRRDQHLIG